MNANRARDYLIYISIGLALVGFVIWGASHWGPVHQSAIKWIGLAGTTPILFGYALSEYRPNWHQPRFWGVVLILLAAHLGAFALILSHVDRWGLLGFVLVFPIENAGIYAALLRAGYRPFVR